MRLAGRFGRRVRAFTDSNGPPVIDCEAGRGSTSSLRRPCAAQIALNGHGAARTSPPKGRDFGKRLTAALGGHQALIFQDGYQIVYLGSKLHLGDIELLQHEALNIASIIPRAYELP